MENSSLADSVDLRLGHGTVDDLDPGTDSGEENDRPSPLHPRLDAEVLSEIKRLIALPSPWVEMDPNRKLQYLDIKVELKKKFGRNITKLETDEIKRRLRPLSSPFSSFATNRSLLNLTTDTTVRGGFTSQEDLSGVLSPMRRDDEFLVKDKDTGQTFSIEEVEHYFPLELYDTWSQAEEVEVVLKKGPAGAIFTAEWGTIGVRDEKLTEHNPLRIRSFKRHKRTGQPLQLEASGLVSVGDTLVAINGKSMRGRSWALVARRLKEVPRPATLTFEKHPSLSRKHNARSVRRKIVHQRSKIRNKQVRNRLKFAERQLRNTLESPQGIKILAGEMRFNGGSISLAKYTLLFNLQKAILKSWINEHGKHSLLDGPPSRKVSSIHARAAVEAARRSSASYKNAANVRAYLGESQHPDLTEHEQSMFSNSHDGYEGDMDESTIRQDDPDDTTIDHSPIRASAEIDGEISHSQFSKGLSNVSAIEHHYDIDEDESAWSDGPDGILNASDGEMSLEDGIDIGDTEHI